MTITADDFTTDADRWGFRKGARFVGPDEWLHGLPEQWTRDSLHGSTFTDALAVAADDNGVILNFRPNEFYAGPLSDVLRNDDDPEGWTLKYDRFSAMTLLDIEMALGNAGYLAVRGNGDSKDRRLTLPDPKTPRG